MKWHAAALAGEILSRSQSEIVFVTCCDARSVLTALYAGVSIAVPPTLHYGSKEMKSRVLSLSILP